MPRARAVAIALVALCAGGASCRREHGSSGAPGVGARKDGMGRPVRLPRPDEVRRVVSLAPSSTEILYALGAGDRVVGVDGYSDWPAAVRGLPKVGADVDPSLERIVGLRPDVVFGAQSANSQRTVETLERLGVPVYVSAAETLDGIYADIQAIGEVIGRAAAATELVATMRRRVAAVEARAATVPPVKALIVVWSEPLVVAGPRSHVSALLRAAGGETIVDDSAQAFPTFSVERMIARAPEVVVVGTHSTGAPPLGPLQRLGGGSDGGTGRFRIELVDGDLLFRPGPRVVEGAEALERLLHHPGSHR